MLFQDEGEGINSSNKTKVFLPFFTTKAEGTGLGLSLTQQIILEHGGTIECLDNSPKGAIVKINFQVSI